MWKWGEGKGYMRTVTYVKLHMDGCIDAVRESIVLVCALCLVSETGLAVRLTRLLLQTALNGARCRLEKRRDSRRTVDVYLYLFIKE